MVMGAEGLKGICVVASNLEGRQLNSNPVICMSVLNSFLPRWDYVRQRAMVLNRTVRPTWRDESTYLTVQMLSPPGASSCGYTRVMLFSTSGTVVKPSRCLSPRAIVRIRPAIQEQKDNIESL